MGHDQHDPRRQSRPLAKRPIRAEARVSPKRQKAGPVGPPDLRSLALRMNGFWLGRVYLLAYSDRVRFVPNRDSAVRQSQSVAPVGASSGDSTAAWQMTMPSS